MTKADRRQRVVTLAFAGGAALLVGFVIVRLIEQKLVWHPAPPRAAWASSLEDSLSRKNGLAPVLLATEWNDGSGGGRYAKTLRLTLRKGKVIEGDIPVPTEGLRTYINTAATQRGLERVMLFPASATTLGELMPVLDECRHAKVEIVLLSDDMLPP